jgi:site-specific DNA-methyltransferase (adenine-specific)
MIDLSYDWRVVEGEALELLQGLPDGCVDAVLTDPPYGLSGQPKIEQVLTDWLAGREHDHKTSGGICGAKWDKFVPGPHYWREVCRVVKPGGHLLCFAGSRTFDLMSMAIRLGGFECRDSIANFVGPSALAWMYAQGLKRGESLKPAFEPILVFRRPLPKNTTMTAQMANEGIGNLNFDAVSIPRDPDDKTGWHESGADGSEGYNNTGSFKIRPMSSEEIKARCGKARQAPNAVVMGEDMAEAIRCMSGSDPARFFPVFYCPKPSRFEKEAGCEEAGLPLRMLKRMNSGGLSREKRFAPIEVRNHHLTVKPLKLARFLVRLCSWPGQILLDPWCGSGSFGAASILEGRKYIGLDNDPEAVPIARARIRYWQVKSQVVPE